MKIDLFSKIPCVFLEFAGRVKSKQPSVMKSFSSVSREFVMYSVCHVIIETVVPTSVLIVSRYRQKY